MTAAGLRSSPNLSVPQTQNTAPVYEFNCLYTHDLRRKQKRWQDGFLRYHTFNKRVMVYDVPRNFLGDLHWTNGDDLHEGDEMTLEKGGIMVEVSERVGTTQTDLSDLLQRKEKTPAKTPASSLASFKPRTPHTAVASSSVSRAAPNTAQPYVKHKSLNTLLGPSRRPIGKASLPTESPFDLRNKDKENAAWDSSRNYKRQKTEARGMPTTRTSKPAQRAVTAADSQHMASTLNPQSACEIINISSDTEESVQVHTSDQAMDADLLSTSSPSRFLDSPAPAPFIGRSNLRQNIDPPVEESPSVRPQQKERAVPSPAPVSVNPARETDSQKRGRSLKLVGGAPRKMLVFQSQKSRAPSSAADVEQIGRGTSHETRRDKESPTARETTRLPRGSVEAIYRRRMQERLAQMGKKRTVRSDSSPEPENEPNNGDKIVEPALEKKNSAETTRHKEPAQIETSVPEVSMPESSFAFAEIDEPVAVFNQPVTVKPNQRPKSVEPGNASRPFKPPTVKTVVSENKPTTTNEGKIDEQLGPWSKEAFDLMDWRPPDRSAHGAKVGPG